MSEWISVEERLPGTDCDVLVWVEDYIYGDADVTYDHFGIAHYNFKYKVWMGDWIEGRTIVSYWRELPEPPNKLNRTKIIE